MFRLIHELKSRRIVLGNLPFLGVSYQSREKDEQYRQRFSDKAEIKKVMRVALKYGVRFFSVSSHKFNDLSPLHLEAIKEIEDEEETDITLIACISIPIQIGGARVNDYRRWKTLLVYEMENFGGDVLHKAMNDPILNCRLQWRENIQNAKGYPVIRLQRELRIDWKTWEKNMDMFSDRRIGWIEPGSETDFLALSRSDLLGELIDRTRDAGYRCLLGSHHLGATAPLLDERRIKGFDGYVTPINKLGVMMFPNRREAEKAAAELKDRGKLIIAIKPFAGGRIKPKEALTYVFRRMEADACIMGVASEKEAEEDFKTAKEVLANK